ncbi:hypothetical protein [Sneathiella limimaris]|uniref:hypothetical protein n=1 Tax=Sneathiella limimaris TaxID=1964213 RepID=UPI001469A500|nr:hypothetical protein [Sneathiella limimaris]
MKQNICWSLLILLLLPLKVAFADNLDAVFQTVQIDDAVIEYDAVSQRNQIKLSITNKGAENLTLVGVRGAGLSITEFQVKLEEGVYSYLGSLTIEPGLTLDFSTGHLKLVDLSQRPEESREETLYLQTVRGEIPFSAHVRQTR